VNIKLIIADYKNIKQGEDLVHLLNEYASDKMGGGTPLSTDVKLNLVSELAKTPHAFSILCYVNGLPAGLANCFIGFSTFKCSPLINIHDFIVLSKFRGNNLSQKILAKVEEVAIQKKCCKITLEVLQGNSAAIGAYSKFGFSNFQLDSSFGNAMFLQKEFDNY